MAWSYLSRIFSFSYGSDGLGFPSSKSDTESPPASRLPPITASSAEHVLARQSGSEITNSTGEVSNESPESPFTNPTSKVPNDTDTAPTESPKSDPTESASEIPNGNVRVFNESPEFMLAELPSASQPSSTNSGIKTVLPGQSDTELSSALLPPTTTNDSLDLEPNLNISQVSLLIRAARKPGNKSALKQVKAFFKKAAKTVRKKQTPAQVYIVDNWDSHSARSRRSSTFSLRSTTYLPSQLANSSSLSLASPKIFVDASAYGIGFVFNDRWLAWTFTPNHQGILLGSDGNINMSWAELIAAELGILTFLSYGYRDMKVLLRSDNMGVVKALRTRTWTPNHGLDIILARVIHLCEEGRLELEVGWIPTEENPADGPSRGEYPPLDAMLDHSPPIPQYLQGVVNPVEAP